MTYHPNEAMNTHRDATEAPSPLLAKTDSVNPPTLPRLQFLATGARWTTTLLGIGIATWRDPGNPIAWACAASLVAFTVWQTVERMDLESTPRHLPLVVVIELLIAIIAASVTGGLESPYVLAPMVPLMLAGYSWGKTRARGLAYAEGAVIVALGFASIASPTSSRSTLLLGIVYSLCTILGAVIRRLNDDASIQQTAAASQVSSMIRANDMLVTLHALAQTLPSSLDLTEVTDSLRLRLRDQYSYTSLLVLVREESSELWRTALADGVRADKTMRSCDLPIALQMAQTTNQPLAVGDLLASTTTGYLPDARSGIYAALHARGKVVALIAIENAEPNTYGQIEAIEFGSITGSLALAMDNAIWFSHLRRFGAEAERSRIARDLHDRVAQSLAYVAFELERLSDENAVRSTAEIGEVRDVIRSVVTELRDTLYELRASVSSESDFAGVAERYLDRYERRTGLAVHFDHNVLIRPAVAVEQELWRITQEALENAARHARAETVKVAYSAASGQIVLIVDDDGIGFMPNMHDRDRFGLVGMRERADAIGAELQVDSWPGRGTRIRVKMEVGS